MTCWNCGKKKSWFSPDCGRCGAHDDAYRSNVLFLLAFLGIAGVFAFLATRP